MLKYKPWLKDIKRKTDNMIDSTAVRLDKSERVELFSNTLFDEFMSNITQYDFISYPDEKLLKHHLSQYNHVYESQIYTSFGSDGVIKTMFECFVTPASTVLTTNPCFPMYSVYTSLFNAKLETANYDDHLEYHISDLYNKLNESVSLVVIANPNNPIGDIKSEIDLIPLVEKAEKLGVPVLIDEAYAEFSTCNATSLLSRYKNVFVAKTFSKAFGGAGVRLGYIIGDPAEIEMLTKWKPMYGCTGIAVKFAEFMLNNSGAMKQYCRDTVIERDIAAQKLLGVGYSVINSNTNWIHVNDTNDNVGTTAILNNNNVLYKYGAVIPFDHRKNWIRLTVGPGITKMPFFNQLLIRNDI